MPGTVRGRSAGMVATSTKPLLAPSLCGRSHASAHCMAPKNSEVAVSAAVQHLIIGLRSVLTADRVEDLALVLRAEVRVEGFRLHLAAVDVVAGDLGEAL